MEQWPADGTTYESLGPGDLARELRERFVERVPHELTQEDREFTAAHPEPTIDIGTTPGGERLLRITWGGNQTTTEWDGTREDAIDTIDEVAASDSYNASGDCWLTGGWRTRTPFHWRRVVARPVIGAGQAPHEERPKQAIRARCCSALYPAMPSGRGTR